MRCLKKLKIEPLKIEGFTEEQNRMAEDRLEKELQSWDRTPYRPGQCKKGRGVNCVRFTAAIYDELTGSMFRYDKLPEDASLHNKKLAEAALRKFLKMYPCSKVKGDTVQPGDVIICGPVGKNGGPGHGMIVGKHTLWHVDSKCVCRAGLAVMQQGAYAFKQIRRLKDRSVMLGGKHGQK